MCINKMECVIDCDEIKESNIIFKLPIRNQNTKYSNFYKILYSTSNMSMKYILISTSKIKCMIEEGQTRYNVIVEQNDEAVKSLCKIETMILEAINNKLNKNIVLNLTKDIREKPYLYSFPQYPSIKHLLIKISGVWESSDTIGLVYKFTYNTSTEKLSSMIC